MLSIELEKLIKRKTTLAAIFIFFIIPLIFVLLIKTNNSSISMTGKVNEYTFTLTIWEMLRVLKVSYLIPILLTTTNLGKEISDYSISMYLIRVDRRKYYWSKLLSNLILTTIIYIAFLTSSIIFSKLLLLGTEFFEVNSYSMTMLVYGFVLGYLELILFTIVAYTMSVFWGNVGGILSSLFVVIIFIILSNIKKILLLLPTHICDFTRLIELSTASEIMKDAVRVIPVLAIYIAAFWVIGYVTFQKMDFK